ncbi:MAG: lipoprotein-releasing ABC transporter permease subunit [Gammaproteobacteria bacterium]|nr:lipoprotein-releasing ABC transporter permease subunit [Gammaproteobacteria bacterium]
MFRPLEIFIGLRYTRAKRRHGYISVFSFISVLCIMVGVMALIIVLSVMNGFEKELRERILGMASHATIMPISGHLSDWQALIKHAKKNPEVISAAPYIDGEVMLNQGQTVSGAVIRGVDPEYEMTVSDVGEKMTSGSFSDLVAGDYGIVLGSELAALMGVSIGDKVTVITPQATSTPIGILPRLKRFTVVGVFEVGMYEYDRTMAFMNVVDASKLFRITDGVTGVRLKLQDMDNARQVASELVADLDEHYWVSDWTRRHANFFKAVKLEKKVMTVIVSLILFVAALAIISTLIMMVTDKQGDIAILRTLGMSPGSILKIFLVQGMVIGFVGVGLGMLTGSMIAINVETIVAFLETTFHVKFLAPDIYYISELPSDLRWSDVVSIGTFAFILSVLATLIPSWLAFRVQPAEALRYE